MESASPSRASVTRAASESLIAAVASRTVDANAGIFGPHSISWKINRESALFLGAGRAALLQLAHPWVATALQQHSSLLHRPIARFHNTFRIVFTMIFGSLPQATAAARHLYNLHTRIQGQMPESVAAYPRGAHYQANEVAALRWVYATLVESAVLAYECVLPALSAQQLETYYAESKTLAALFGLPAEALPENWNAFRDYCSAMELSADLGASPAARGMAHALLAGAGSRVKPPRWYRALTTAWLAPRFVQEFDLSLSPQDVSSLRRARIWLPRIYPRLPHTLRFVGPYLEASARLAGRAPTHIAQISNRFWIGDRELPFQQQSVTPNR